jgi:hypothetical protein
VLDFNHLCRFQSGHCALIIAAQKGNASLLSLLLEAGANKDAAENVRDTTCHISAISTCHVSGQHVDGNNEFRICIY